MKPPTVSVLMPAYNAERYVEQAVRSVLAQTFADFELIVVDDGSTDRTRAIVERLAAEDCRIRLISRPNLGIGATRNEALALARGELLAVMDADDVTMPDRFERQVAFLAEHPEVVCIGGRIMTMDPDGRPLAPGHLEVDHEELLDVAVTGLCPMNHSSILMRTAAVRAVGGYRPETCPAEDLDLFLRLTSIGRLHNLPVVVTHYRLHPHSASERQHLVQMDRARFAVADASARLGLPDRFVERAPWRPSDRASRLHFALWFGWNAYRLRDRRAAAHYGLKAVAATPWKPGGWRLLACTLLKAPRSGAAVEGADAGHSEAGRPGPTTRATR